MPTPEWLAYTQIVANMTLATAAFCVAVASAIFSYRDNFGWKPVILFTAKGIKYAPDSANIYIILCFEVRNRQKYPISIRTFMITFEDLIFEPPAQSANAGSDKWLQIGPNGPFVFMSPYSLDPSDHQEVRLSATRKNDREFSNYDDKFKILLEYYDPRWNKVRSLEHTLKLSFLDRHDREKYLI